MLGKEVSSVIRASEVVFILTMEDVLTCAEEMGVPKEAITDDVFHQVKKGVEFGLEYWSEVVKTALTEALTDIDCPSCKTRIALLKMGNRVGGTCSNCGFKVS